MRISDASERKTRSLLNIYNAYTKKHRLLKAVAKPSFDRVVIYDNDLLGGV